MPRRKKNNLSDEKIIEKQQQTNTGIYVQAGQIELSDYDKTDWITLQQDYYKMRVSDPLLSTTIDIIKYPIMMASYHIETKNKELQEYLNFVFENIKKGFNNFKYHKLLGIDFGLSMHEIIVKRADYWNGKITNRPIAFNPIQNETIQEFHYNEQAEFSGIKHRRRIPNAGDELIDIVAEDLDYFTYGEIYNDIRGSALYRPDRIFWESKHKVITAKTNGIIRGAGFASIGVNGKPSTEDQNKIELIGRTIASAKNAYFSYDKDKISVELLELKNQQDVIPYLDYLDRQLFFNTLSQAATSGIGGNGSRAATSEQKPLLEMFSSYVLSLLQENFQKLTDRIVDMSWAANVPEDEWPEFKFNSIASRDLNKVSQYLKSLYDTAILTKQPEDEKYLREYFGMPELKIESAPIKTPQTIFGETKRIEKINKRELTAELIEFENKIFSVDSATEHYQTFSEKAKEEIQTITKLFFDDILLQLSGNKDKEIIIRSRILSRALEIAVKLYEEGFQRGITDIKKEINKLEGPKKLATGGNPVSKKTKIIEKGIKNYYYKIKNVLESNLGKVSGKYIEKMGGLNEYLTGFEVGFGSEKGTLQTELENSYVDGRGETLLDLGEDIETYYYTSILDNHLCDECAPFDGLIMTKPEIEEAGLNFVSPINPFCLGKYHDPNTCRCQIMTYSLLTTEKYNKRLGGPGSGRHPEGGKNDSGLKQQMKMPKSQYDTITPEQNTEFKNKIDNIIKNSKDESDFYSLRVDEKEYKINDILPSSRIWVDGNPTDDYTAGTSGLRYNPSKENENILKDILPYKWAGDQIYILSGNNGQGGEDINEIIIEKPKVIGIIKMIK